jgi:(p)ppGpp synthase/HD superfamily hydrolase
MEPLTSARSYATLHHVIRKGQLYGVLPYTHHLAAVEEVLREFGETRDELLVAAWLHDIVEDTDVKLRDVEEHFGAEVALLVGAVTSEDGENRKIRNALTYPKIRETGVDAVRLKLADRIANVRHGGSSVSMYLKEHKNFKHALYSSTTKGFEKSINDKMWAELDSMLGWFDE